MRLLCCPQPQSECVLVVVVLVSGVPNRSPVSSLNSEEAKLT